MRHQHHPCGDPYQYYAQVLSVHTLLVLMQGRQVPSNYPAITKMDLD
jgi:hypothetical protein